MELPLARRSPATIVMDAASEAVASRSYLSDPGSHTLPPPPYNGGKERRLRRSAHEGRSGPQSFAPRGYPEHSTRGVTLVPRLIEQQ